jgi:hypothetical protein
VEFSKDCSSCIATNICAEDNLYKGCACKKFHELVEEKFTSTNSDYATALKVASLFRDSGIDITLEHFEQWCFERLHSSTNVA